MAEQGGLGVIQLDDEVIHVDSEAVTAAEVAAVINADSTWSARVDERGTVVLSPPSSDWSIEPASTTDADLLRAVE